MVLWIISGLSSIGSGLVPLDVNLELHALVSIPAIVLQPVALGLHALSLVRQEGSGWWAMVGIAVALLAVSIFFLLRLEVQWGGLLERIVIWPVLLVLPVLAARGSGRGQRGPDHVRRSSGA